MQLFRDCLRLADYISSRVCFIIPSQHELTIHAVSSQSLRLQHHSVIVTHPLSFQGGNRQVLRAQVKEAFRRNQHETDLQKIEEQKQAYVVFPSPVP